MKLGVKVLEKSDLLDTRNQIRTISDNAGGGKNGGEGGDDGNEFSEPTIADDREIFTPDKYRILMLFLLLVVLMTFGGLVAAYVSLQTNKAQEWKTFPLPYQVWVSTALILFGSMTYALFERTSLAGRDVTARKWLIVTSAVGATFISSQLLVWYELVSGGFYMQGNPYAGFFYILTAVHAVHVIGGIIAIGSLIHRLWLRPRTAGEVEQRNAFAHVVGWYWHVMAALWVVLIFFLGFWK